MPPATWIYRDDYPHHGWASYFGRISGTTGPWSYPYAFWVRAGGSDGVFSELSSGMWFVVDPLFAPDAPIYQADAPFSGATVPPNLNFAALPNDGIQIIFNWYLTLTPLAFYQGDAVGTWSNTRNRFLAGNNAFWVPAIFPSVVGAQIELRPFNRGAYEKFS